MSADFDYEKWEDWDDEDLDEEFEDEVIEFEEDDDDEVFTDCLSGPLGERMRWYQARTPLDDVVNSDDVLDFHFFIEGTRGICKGERNFFNRMKLYFYDKS